MEVGQKAEAVYTGMRERARWLLLRFREKVFDARGVEDAVGHFVQFGEGKICKSGFKMGGEGAELLCDQASEHGLPTFSHYWTENGVILHV